MPVCTARSTRKNSVATIPGIVLMLCAGALSLAADQQPQMQVLVVSASGDWRQAGSAQKTVVFGQHLDAGAGCLSAAPGDNVAVVLKYANPSDSTLYPFHCDEPPKNANSECPSVPVSQCSVNLKHLAGRNGAPSTYQELSAGFKKLWSGESERYMVASSRGIEADLTDAVVQLQNGQVELSAAFRTMPAGKYFVEFLPVNDAHARPSPVPVVVAKGQKASAPAPSLGPGLYEILLVDEKGEPAGSDAWILAANSATYATKAADYQKAEAESAKLPPEMDPSATRAVLRAYLESLSEEKQAVEP